MKKINVRSPFFITVQKETAKIDPTDPCLTDPSGNCLPVDPCIANPNLPQCDPVKNSNHVFQERALVCGASPQAIGRVGAQVYNFEIDTGGRENGNYVVSLNDLQTPVRIRMDVLANVPQTDITTGTAFENVGLTDHSTNFTQAGYSSSGLSGTADSDGNLDITKTFAYNSSSHTGNLRFQLHVPVVTNAGMTISLTCPAKRTVTTVPNTVVTVISFSSLNTVVNSNVQTQFRPSVKLNGVELGDGDLRFTSQTAVNEEVFQAATGTIMGVGRFQNDSSQFINTRRFIQAETTSGAAGTGLTPLTPLTLSSGGNSIRNREFMGNIPNGNIADFSIRTFSATNVNTKVTYKGNNFISDGKNTIEVLLPNNFDDSTINLEKLVFQISISKHTVKSYTHSPSGLYIAPPLSTNAGTNAGAAEAMVFRGIMYGSSSKLTLDFEGNNNTDLNFDKQNHKHRFEIENPAVEDLSQSVLLPDNLTPFEQIQDPRPVSLQVNTPFSQAITIPL